MTINQIGSCKRCESIFEAGFFRSLYLIFQLSLNSKHYLFTDSRRIFLNNLKKKQAVTWDHSLCCFCLKSPNRYKESLQYHESTHFHFRYRSFSRNRKFSRANAVASVQKLMCSLGVHMQYSRFFQESAPDFLGSL